MIATRLGTLLLLATLATAQQTAAPKPGKSSIPDEPELPVIDYNVCPFEGCVFREWTVTKRSALYDRCREERKAIGELTEGEKVQGVTGVHITRKPAWPTNSPETRSGTGGASATSVDWTEISTQK